MTETEFKPDLTAQDVAKAQVEHSKILIDLIEHVTEARIDIVKLKRRVSELEGKIK